jgi:hypothetical protein
MPGALSWVAFPFTPEDKAVTVPDLPQKVLAVFGSDLQAEGPAFLSKKVLQERFHVIALDSIAVGLLEEAGLPYSVFDDWVTPEERVQAQQQALLAERSWFEPAREEFTVEGICWPEIDRYVMRGFWIQAMMALALGKSLRDRGCGLLSFFGSYMRRPAIQWNPSDSAGTLWRSESVEHVKEIKRFTLAGTDEGIAALWTKVKRRLGSRAHRKRSAGPGHVSGALDNKIVLVLAYGQRDRYAHAVDHLKQHFPGRVAAVLSGPYPDLAVRLSSEWSIPVSSGPPLPVTTVVSQLPRWLTRSCDPGLARRFLAAYEKCRAASRGTPWHVPLKAIAFHFAYYCTEWWPTLCRRTASFWTGLFRDQRPAALMVPAVESSEYLLPCVAAQRVGVRTFVIPEAALRTMYFGGLFSSSMLLYELPLQKSFLERSGYASDRLVSVRSLLSDRQYHSKQTPNFVEKDKMHVLVLTNPTGLPGMLMHLIGLRAQYEALRILANPPADLGRRIELRMKVHPVYHDLDMISAVSKELADRVLRPEADLEQTLSCTDLVVAANYHGSALVHCLRLGKPVILLSTESEAVLHAPMWAYDMYQSGVTVVRDADTFWETIERFRSDAHTRAAMERMSHAFAREQLDQSTFPPLHQVLHRMLDSR